MYDRFTDRARKAMQLANQEAQRCNHEHIGTEHLLLGLVKEGGAVTANLLKKFGIGLPEIRQEVQKLVPNGPGTATMGRLQQTPSAKAVIESALEEARRLNHSEIGTEHILLGLLHEQGSRATQVLANLGLKDVEDIRREVRDQLESGFKLLRHSVSEKNSPGGIWQRIRRRLS